MSNGQCLCSILLDGGWRFLTGIARSCLCSVLLDGGLGVPHRNSKVLSCLVYKRIVPSAVDALYKSPVLLNPLYYVQYCLGMDNGVPEKERTVSPA